MRLDCRAVAGVLLCLPPAALSVEPLPRALQPAAVTAEGSAFTLSVTGQGFTYSTRVLWDGAPLTTYFDSATRITAEIAASRITRPGIASVAVSLSDGQTSEALILTVNPPLGWITPSLLPSAATGQFYSQALAVSGGTSPTRFSLQAGAMPPGLHLDGYNGTVVGYATTLGEYAFTVRAADSGGGSIQQSFRLSVAGELRITSGPPLPPAIVGQPYSTLLAAEGGSPPISEWKIAAGTLPRGLVLNQKTGIISGTAVAPASTSQFTVTVRDSSGRLASRQLTLDVRAPLSISPLPATLDWAEGDSVSHALNAAGGVPPLVWALDGGELPAGLTLDTEGRLRGVLSRAGTWRPILRVRDASGADGRATLALSVKPGFSVAGLGDKDVVVGLPVSLVFTAAGGTAPYAWSLVSTLPDGVRFSAGRIEGSPRAAGDFLITVEARDSAQRQARASARLIASEPPLPSLLLAPLSRLRPGEQAKLDVRLDKPYPSDLTVGVQVAFDGPPDPAILLSSGSRETRLTIPAGQLTPPQALQLQTGTSSGVLTVEARMASQSAVQSAVVDALPPQIRSVQLQKTSDGFDVVISAFSPTRELESATFAFDGALSVQLPAGELVNAWYNDDRSVSYGTLFVYRQGFTVRGDASGLRGVSVTLTNRVGASIPASATF